MEIFLRTVVLFAIGACAACAASEVRRELEGHELQDVFNELEQKWKSQSGEVFTAKVKFRASLLFPGYVRPLSLDEVKKILLQAGKMPQKDAFEYLVRHFVNEQTVEQEAKEGFTFFPIRHQELAFDKDYCTEYFKEFDKKVIRGGGLIISKDISNCLVYVELPSSYPLALTSFSAFRFVPNLTKAREANVASKIFDCASTLELELTGRGLEVEVITDKQTLFVQKSSTRRQGSIINQRMQYFPFFIEKNDCFPQLSVTCDYEGELLYSVNIYEIEDLSVNIPLPQKEFQMDADEKYAVVDRRKAPETMRQVTKHVEDVVRFLDEPETFSPGKSNRNWLIVSVNIVGILIIYILIRKNIISRMSTAQLKTALLNN